MGKIKLMVLAIVAVLLVGCVHTSKGIAGPKVQVTLSDGQKVIGHLTTQEMVLQSKLGQLKFNATDAGELGLVEGKNVEQSGNMIRLWLRNGSEFIGAWQKPSITIGMQIGGEEQKIQVPIKKLERLQFHGKAVWPGSSFRIVTRQGDDFFVDVTNTKMIFVNEMGTFKPFLSEIRQLQPMDDEKQEWNIRLENGSVFIAKLKQETLDIHLSMGPKKLGIPLKEIVRMNRENIFNPNKNSGYRSGSYADEPDNYAPEEPLAEDFDNETDGSAGEFYSNTLQKNAKQASQDQILNNK